MGRVPHRAKRPLWSMMGSGRQRPAGGDPPAEGTSGGGPAEGTQEELEQLRKDLASQKVRLRVPRARAPSWCPMPDPQVSLDVCFWAECRWGLLPAR